MRLQDIYFLSVRQHEYCLFCLASLPRWRHYQHRQTSPAPSPPPPPPPPPLITTTTTTTTQNHTNRAEMSPSRPHVGPEFVSLPARQHRLDRQAAGARQHVPNLFCLASQPGSMCPTASGSPTVPGSQVLQLAYEATAAQPGSQSFVFVLPVSQMETCMLI